MTSDTRYVLNKVDVTLADFRIAVNSIANKNTNIATVIHHLEADVVIEVNVVK